MNPNTKNSVTLTGNLGSAAEIFNFDNGKKLAKVSLAINENYKSGEETIEKTSWFNLAFWNEKADLVANLAKGDFVEVKGALKPQSYQDKDGATKHTIEIVIFELRKIEKVEKDS